MHSRKLFPMMTIAASLLGATSAARADEKITYKAPGSETTLTVKGYVKLDAIWSDVSAGTDSVGDQTLSINTVPVGPSAGEHKRNQFTMHARQSRISLGTSTPTVYGEMTTFIEGDFFGSDGNESTTNSSGFRIRHAYGSLGKFSAGQYWTNFFNEQAYVETLDFGGPVGEMFVRQAQVRWTEKFARGDWSVSAENAEAVLAVPGSSTTFRSDSDHVPDLTARTRLVAGGAVYSAGALVRNIHVDTAALGNSGRWGGAIALTGIVPAGARDDLRVDFNFGNAIGRYQNGGFFPDGYVDAQGKVQLARQTSGYAAYRHFWTAELRSTLALSAATSNPPSGTAAGVNKSDRSGHVNLIWSPVPAVNLGAEYIHAQRTVVGGDSGSLNRIQFSAQYSF